MKRFGYEKVKFDDPPSMTTVYGRMLRELPETLRYAWNIYRIYSRLRNPEKWGKMSAYARIFFGLNPEWWDENRDIQIPVPPPIPEEKVYPPTRSGVS